jgi:hypothetical protein
VRLGSLLHTPLQFQKKMDMVDMLGVAVGIGRASFLKHGLHMWSRAWCHALPKVGYCTMWRLSWLVSRFGMSCTGGVLLC